MPCELKNTDTQLAEEFRAQPYGRHSPALEAALDRLRMVNPDGKFIVVCTDRGREWTVAHLVGEPPRAVLHPELVFASTEEAEWAVFKRRWKHMRGVEPDVE